MSDYCFLPLHFIQANRPLDLNSIFSRPLKYPNSTLKEFHESSIIDWKLYL